MKLPSIIALSLALACSPALAQVNPGTQPLSIAKGGTAGATAAAARTNLGLAIGSNVQAWNALLDCFSALVTTGIVRRTGAGTCSAGTAVNLTAEVTGTLPIGNGGTGRTTAPAARAASGLNVDQFTGHGDSNYSILATDRTVGTDTTFTASRTWTLPAANAVNPGQEIIVADFQGTVTGSNTLVISRAGADTINGGGTTVTISAANGGYLLKSDGVSRWTAQALGAASGGGVTSVTCFGVAITGSGTCVTAASKSDQQTGTSNVVAVAPLHQQDHDSALKASVKFAGTVGAAIASSYNVSGVVRNSAGSYTVTLTTAFASAAEGKCTVTPTIIGTVVVPGVDVATTNTVNILLWNLSGTPTDPAANVTLICTGRQ